MNEWLLLKNNINRLFRTLLDYFIIDIRMRKLSRMEHKIEKVKRNLEVEMMIYKEYLSETKTIVERIRKECE